MTATPPASTGLAETDLTALETFAIEIAHRVGLRLLERLGEPLAVEFKAENRRSPVTDADRDAEAALRAAIRAQYPDHSILGEEGEDHRPDAADFVWVLDPLDGTTNFINRLPLFCVSVGLLHRKQPVAGAIFAATGHRGRPGVYHARRGGGAFLDDERLAVPAQPQPSPARLAAQPAGFGRRRGAVTAAFRRQQGEVRVLGSIAQELALTAAGVLQYAIFLAPRIWDVAAGVLIVQEAGGVALVGGPRRGGAWNDLRTFEPAPPRRPDGPAGELAGLRRWQRPMVVGAPGIAAFVTTHMRLPQAPRTPAGRMVARAVNGLRRLFGQT